jgi:two-component system cell cycle sensor histidine kinase/response regulator CckA
LHDQTPEQPTILVVEDLYALRWLIKNSLESQGYRVLEASSGAEALAFGQFHGGTLRLLITDVWLPDLQGPALAARLKRSHPDLLVLLISGGSIPDGYEHLEKPFLPQELIEKVRKMLAAP